MSNIVLGSDGEKIASKYLLEQGLLIINRNVRSKFGEIDIIAWRTGTIHFVEVKTRIGDEHGKPYEAITYHKLTHMRRSAEHYVLKNRLTRHKLSLDVISIILHPDHTVQNITFFENITK